jgi:hypothetical protein
MLELDEVECLVCILAIILSKKIVLLKVTCTPLPENYGKEKIFHHKLNASHPFRSQHIYLFIIYLTMFSVT